jgi:hypothetical protein
MPLSVFYWTTYADDEDHVLGLFETEAAASSTLERRKQYGTVPRDAFVFRCDECKRKPCSCDAHRMSDTVLCCWCSKLERLVWDTDVNRLLLKRKLCFNCDFWMEYVRCKDNPAALRIGGKHYWIDDERSSGSRGFSGRRFVIRKGSVLVTTTNLWHQGTIPELFRDLLPDNAEFVEG